MLPQFYTRGIKYVSLCLCVFCGFPGRGLLKSCSRFPSECVPMQFCWVFLVSSCHNKSWVLSPPSKPLNQGPSTEMNTKCHGKNIRKRTKKVRYADLNNELLKENYLQTIEHMLTSFLFFPQVLRQLATRLCIIIQCYFIT